MREITYCEAVNEALHQEMEADKSVVLIGQGVTSPWYVGGTCKGLLDRFGLSRVIDTPISESAVSGAAIGAALAGLKPVVVFPRMDFMMYAMDAIINHAAKWHYIFGGQSSVPVVFWGIINRGGCQGAQHSQDFTWLFSAIEGLKVVSPKNAYEAKGLMAEAISDPNPVVFVDNRERYGLVGNVPPLRYRMIIDGFLKKHAHDDLNTFPAPCSEVLEREYFRIKD